MTRGSPARDDSPRTILAFDHGRRNIGVAVGQSLTRTATPLSTLRAHDAVPEWAAVARLVEGWQPQAMVVGLPLNMDGTEQDTTRLARRFRDELERRFGVPVHLVDERLSTREARERLARGGRARADDDPVAAQVILEDWFSQNSRRMPAPPASRRGTIVEEEARILEHERFEAGQHRLRMLSPRIARTALPGSFVHVRCDALLPMRRPMSILRAERAMGWVDLLFKEVGTGTRLLAQKEAGARLSLLGPIGNHFEARPGSSRPLLLGGGVGMPPVVFLARYWRESHPQLSPLVLLGSEVPFPFTVCRTAAVPHLPAGADAGVEGLERLGVASRLASRAGIEGCYPGHVTDLARDWLRRLPSEARGEVAVYACGPVPMLEAAAALADEYSLPAQVCLEEYMACAVGGCAGCAVRIRTPSGPAMQRVCVDGPVFDAHRVVWPRADGSPS